MGRRCLLVREVLGVIGILKIDVLVVECVAV